MNWGDYKRTDTHEKCRLNARALLTKDVADTIIKVLLVATVIIFIGVKL